VHLVEALPLHLVSAKPIRVTIIMQLTCFAVGKTLNLSDFGWLEKPGLAKTDLLLGRVSTKQNVPVCPEPYRQQP
jgi:hypothetical protein